MMEKIDFSISLLTGFIGGLIGSSISLVFQLITRWANNYLSSHKELKLLLGELSDIRRHCNANKEILVNINTSNGIPSKMHFEKMKVAHYSILYSTETFKSINSKHSKQLYDLKLLMRNVDIEIATVLDYIHDNEYDKKTMDDYIDYLEKKFAYLYDRLECIINELETDKYIVYNGKSRPRNIIYEKMK